MNQNKAARTLLPAARVVLCSQQPGRRRGGAARRKQALHPLLVLRAVCVVSRPVVEAMPAVQAHGRRDESTEAQKERGGGSSLSSPDEASRRDHGGANRRRKRTKDGAQAGYWQRPGVGCVIFKGGKGASTFCVRDGLPWAWRLGLGIPDCDDKHLKSEDQFAPCPALPFLATCTNPHPHRTPHVSDPLHREGRVLVAELLCFLTRHLLPQPLTITLPYTTKTGRPGDTHLSTERKQGTKHQALPRRAPRPQ